MLKGKLQKSVKHSIAKWLAQEYAKDGEDNPVIRTMLVIQKPDVMVEVRYKNFVGIGFAKWASVDRDAVADWDKHRPQFEQEFDRALRLFQYAPSGSDEELIGWQTAKFISAFITTENKNIDAIRWDEDFGVKLATGRAIENLAIAMTEHAFAV